MRREAGRHPTYGYRRLTAEVRRQHRRFRRVNAKRVRRVMKTAGIQVKRRRRTRRTTDSAHGFQRYPNLVQGLTVVRPDQVWVCDIAAIQLANGSWQTERRCTWPSSWTCSRAPSAAGRCSAI